jgi:hypothetical protein
MEEQDRGISFTGRIYEITFASNISCLAKERCIPRLLILKYTWQQLSERKREFINLYCMKSVIFRRF